MRFSDLSSDLCSSDLPLSPASWLRSHILWDSVPVGRGARWGGAEQLPALVRRYFRNARTMRNSGSGRLFLKGRAGRSADVERYSAARCFEQNVAQICVMFLASYAISRCLRSDRNTYAPL